jgi:hypothetical protein
MKNIENSQDFFRNIHNEFQGSDSDFNEFDFSFEESIALMNMEMPNAAINLFVWCILFNRVEIAKIIIQNGEVNIFLIIL